MSKVFVKVDQYKNIVEINSEHFIKNLAGWILIDSGSGDKYSHAQNNYLDGPLLDDSGNPRYKLENGSVTIKT